MFLLNSRTLRFTATSISSRRKPFTYRRHTLSLSYGVNMQSSLTTVLSSALVYSTHPPVSVSGTGTNSSPRETFLGSVGSAANPAAEALEPHPLSALMAPRFDPTVPAYRIRLGHPEPSQHTLLRHPSLQRTTRGTGILTCYPSPTAFTLGLGPG